MTRHLIAVDLDGTLLKDDKTISAANIAALQSARANGHEVVIATGRPFRHARKYYEQLGLTTPIVNFNGGLVHHPQDIHFEVQHHPIPLKTVQHILESVAETKTQNIVCEVTDHVYFQYDPVGIYEFYTDHALSVTTGDLRKVLMHEPTSLLIHAKGEHVDEIRSELSGIHAETVLNRQWVKPEFMVEVMRKGTSKAVGLAHIADHLGINSKQIVAFGDEENDLEMIEYAGHGVAMGNAIPALKHLATGTTKRNEDDGIAYYLRHVLGLA
ncbi:Cof-type HAD-IIB family hydrolase [Exiguobacterium acetylicum]|uniref:Cof-type HAD-IIB family hydrolase n=1 Tax=Exiguobacterium acetylicum TaxID=41170 RepID=UPI0038768DDC